MIASNEDGFFAVWSVASAAEALGGRLVQLEASGPRLVQHRHWDPGLELGLICCSTITGLKIIPVNGSY